MCVYNERRKETRMILENLTGPVLGCSWKKKEDEEKTNERTKKKKKLRVLKNTIQTITEVP
jgi:hypothetical protein